MLPAHTQLVTLLIFALVVSLIILDGVTGIGFELSSGGWELLHYILPAGFVASLAGHAVITWKSKK